MQERFIEKLRRRRFYRGSGIQDLDSAIAFLEADPWFFGSGYLKADLLKIITQVELSHLQLARLRKVVVDIVDKRGGREFRWYCRLACKVQSLEVREELRRRLSSGDANIKRRARWMLDWIAENSRQ
jgi:hypothetical protein